MAAPLRIRRARSPQAVREFLEFPYRLHRAEPYWIPPLRRDQAKLLDRNRHPFHKHAQVEYFLARRGRETVGRIAAIENFRYNEYQKERSAAFGFLDAIDDPAVFRALLGAACRWARERGLDVIRGPMSFSTNEECGLLVENFDADPVIMTPWNPPYYQKGVEGAGFAKAEDLVCYRLTYGTMDSRLFRLADGVEGRLVRKGCRIKIRPINPKRFDEELRLVKEVYNKAWEDNWGFVPFTDEEFEHVARELKPVIDPGMALIAEDDGKPAGMLVALPDFNLVLKHMDGRLGPKQILLALMLRRQVKLARVILLGIMPEYRGLGLDLVFYRDLARYCATRDIVTGDLSWLLERNRLIRSTVTAIGGREYRRYRMYEKAL